jgi:predicted MFS family arabinose efflux permease
LFLNSLRALFGSIAIGAYNPMVIDLIKRKEYGRKLGKLHGPHFAGRALGFLLTGLIIVQIGFYLIFFLLLVVECIRVSLLWAFIPEPEATYPSRRTKFLDLKGLPRNVLVLCLLYFVMYLVATPTDEFINQVYAFDFLGMTPELRGIMLVGTSLAEAIMAPLGGRLADKFDTRKIVALGVIGEGMVVLCQPLYPHFPIFAFF